MQIEDLLKSGKSKEEVMKAFEEAYDTAAKANNPEQKPAADDYLSQLTETLEKFNTRLDEIEKRFNEPQPQPEPELGTEPNARKLTDDQVNEALQKLNLLSTNDKIDVNQQIEDNLTKHFGSLIGVDIDAGKE